MTAYDLKEDFFDIYDEHPLSREDAEDAFDAWKASIPDDKAYDPFRGLAKAVENHREFIFNYRDCPSRISNGYTECANRLINETNMMGRGHSFETLRAYALSQFVPSQRYGPTPVISAVGTGVGAVTPSGATTLPIAPACPRPVKGYVSPLTSSPPWSRLRSLCLGGGRVTRPYGPHMLTSFLCACAVPAPIRRGTGAPYLLLPRKDRMRKRKRRDVEGAGRDGVDRTGRTYAEFEALSLADRSRVVQCDSVEGYERNTYDILSAHIVARAFQIYLRKRHASSGSHRCLPRPYRESHRLCCCLRGYLRHPASRLRSRVR